MENQKPKKLKIEPTERQKKAFKYLSENGGSKREALKHAGYSQKVQDSPTRVTRSRGWEMLVEELNKKIKDDDIAKALQEALHAEKKQFKNNVSTGQVEEVAVEPDHAIRLKAIDTTMKIKGQYAPEKKEVKVTNAGSILDLLNDDEINEETTE